MSSELAVELLPLWMFLMKFIANPVYYEDFKLEHCKTTALAVLFSRDKFHV